MNNVIIFHRNRKAGYSIAKVFDILYPYLNGPLQYEMPSPRSLPWNCIQNILFTIKHRNKTGINHISGDVYYCAIGLIGCKTLITYHDLCMVDLNKGLKRYLKGLFWYKIPSQLATKITCISENTKKKLIEYTHCNPNKITVIYNPIPDNYVPQRKKFSETPIILHIGTRSNKNLIRTIKALKDIKCELRIIGELNDAQKSVLLKNNLNYTYAANLTDLEILDEYRKCDIVSFASTYEGFGMPIIEGQAIGRPVITSDLPPMNEISNGASHLVNPYSIDSIRNGFKKIISDNEYRETLINKGFMNSQKYKASFIAQQYINVYERL